MSIKISSRKAKGRNLQKWVCNKIANIFGIDYRQEDDDCPLHSREMGQSGVDIILRGELNKLFPYSIECKSSEKLSLKKTIKQVKLNQKKDTDWLIVYKHKGIKKPIVIMDWEAFEYLIKTIRILSTYCKDTLTDE